MGGLCFLACSCCLHDMLLCYWREQCILGKWKRYQFLVLRYSVLRSLRYYPKYPNNAQIQQFHWIWGTIMCWNDPILFYNFLFIKLGCATISSSSRNFWPNSFLASNLGSYCIYYSLSVCFRAIYRSTKTFRLIWP